MTTKQGDVGLLNELAAQELLHSTIPARFAYVWRDGSPRVVPMVFTWTGEEIVFGSPPNSPKFRTKLNGAKVAITIDTCTAPHKALNIRGTAVVEMIQGIVPEYAQAVERYFGLDFAKEWLGQLSVMSDSVLPANVVGKTNWRNPSLSQRSSECGGA